MGKDGAEGRDLYLAGMAVSAKIKARVVLSGFQVEFV
jgi:hypothetical protein